MFVGIVCKTLVISQPSSHAIERSLCGGMWSSAQITSSGPTPLQLLITAADAAETKSFLGPALSHRELHLPKGWLLANG